MLNDCGSRDSFLVPNKINNIYFYEIKFFNERPAIRKHGTYIFQKYQKHKEGLPNH